LPSACFSPHASRISDSASYSSKHRLRDP
jgi:hypothetical protein